MNVPVILRLKLAGNKLHDINMEMTETQIDNGECSQFVIPEGTFEGKVEIYGFQVIAGLDKVIASREFIFNPIVISGDTATIITSYSTIDQ